MFIENVSSEFAAQIESCEVNAWLDMYAAAPADLARRHELDIFRVQNVVLTRCRTIPFVHFNCVMNLGMTSPTTEEQIDQVLRLYREAGVPEFAVFHIPHCHPGLLADWLKARGLGITGGWERIFRRNSALHNVVVGVKERCRVEKVTQATAPEWAAHICKAYGMSTEPWLLALVDRPGWYHYALWQKERIGAVRSMYIHHDGTAWLGIEAPVPGLMAPSFDLDVQLCQTMLKDGLRLGVRYFVADIEAPSPDMNTPAYRHFEALGFKRPYFRSHYSS